MKISCCWLYAISKYGYPVPVRDIPPALRRMADLGFRYVELEGASEDDNLGELYQDRQAIKSAVRRAGAERGQLLSRHPRDGQPGRGRARSAAHDHVPTGRGAGPSISAAPPSRPIATRPPLEFVGERPYKEMLDYGIEFRMRVDPDFSWERQWDVLVETLQFCARVARKADLPFCLEPRVGEMISNTDALLRLMDHVNEANFGAVLDTAHQHAQKEILPLSVEKLGSRIMYLHVADNDGKINEHLALGEGTVDWAGVFQALDKHQFLRLCGHRHRPPARHGRRHAPLDRLLEAVCSRAWASHTICERGGRG